MGRHPFAAPLLTPPLLPMSGTRESRSLSLGRSLSRLSALGSFGGAGDPEGLVEAVRRGRVRHVQLLLEAGGPVNTPDSTGTTALVAAVTGDPGARLRLVRLLLAGGADPNEGDARGTTPLMHAAIRDLPDVAITLLQHEGVDPGIQDADGNSALMYAAAFGHREILVLVLAAFRKLHHVTHIGQRNAQGLTAQELAETNSHEEIAALLKVESGVRARPSGPSPFITRANELDRPPTPKETRSIKSSLRRVHSLTSSGSWRSKNATSLEEEDLEATTDETFALKVFTTGSRTTNTPTRTDPPAGALQTAVEKILRTSKEGLAQTKASPRGAPENHRVSKPDREEKEVLEHMRNHLSSSPGSGSEADTESLMEAERLSIDEDSTFPLSSSCTPTTSSSKYDLASVTTAAMSQAQTLHPQRKLPQGGGVGVSIQGLHPIPMPRIEMSASTRSLNKSIKSILEEEASAKPGQRPPTPARPSLPTLLPASGRFLDSSLNASISSTKSEGRDGGRLGRRVTFSSLPRSSSEPRSLVTSPEPDEENITDLLDSSTRSEGWEALRAVRSRTSTGTQLFASGSTSSSSSEGHVVPLPPINRPRLTAGGRAGRDGASKSGGCDSVLHVAKKTLEQLETVLAPGDSSSSSSSSSSAATLTRGFARAPRTSHQIHMET